MKRSQAAHRGKFPLLAPLIAEQQPSVDAVMAERAEWWPRWQQERRDRRAMDWRRARAQLDSFGDNLRPVLLRLWNTCPYPADPTYLLMFLHEVETGRIDPANPPWRYAEAV